jgi:hypothetical protein
MTKQIIYEVRQRSPVDITAYRELGVFTDQAMAQQVIDWCYRGAFIEMMKPDFTPDFWLTETTFANMKNNFDRWWADDLNSPYPLFFYVEHFMYGQVPTTDPDFLFHIRA